MNQKINVDGTMYPVVERMGFNHSIGMYSAFVKDGERERVAVWHKGGPARFWGAQDRLSGGSMSVVEGQDA